MKSFGEWLNNRDGQYFDETFRKIGGGRPLFNRQPGTGLFGLRRPRVQAPSYRGGYQSSGGGTDDSMAQRSIDPATGTFSPGQQPQQFTGLSNQINTFDAAQKQKQAGAYDPFNTDQPYVPRYSAYDPLDPSHKEPTGYQSPIGSHPYAAQQQPPYQSAPRPPMTGEEKRLSDLFKNVNTNSKSDMYKIYDNNKAALDAYAKKYNIEPNPWVILNHLEDDENPKTFNSGLYQFTRPAAQ